MSKVLNCDIMPHEPEVISHKFKQKASDLDVFVDLLNRKIRLASPREKIQLLTLPSSPSSWTTEEAMKTFQVSNYSMSQAKKLVQQEGLLALPPPPPSTPTKEG